MRAAIFSLLMLAALLPPIPARAFDCVSPPFGEDFATLNRDREFEKYDERGGISYYHYTGDCRLDPFEDQEDVSWGFVAGKLYARYAQGEEIDMELPVRLITLKFKQEPKVERDGDWVVHTWRIPEDELKYKKKFNQKTQQSKTVLYYLPLSEHLDGFFFGD